MIISALEDKQQRHDIKSGSKKESKDKHKFLMTNMQFK